MVMAYVTATHSALDGRSWQVRTSIPYLMGDKTSPVGEPRAAAHYPSPVSVHSTQDVSNHPKDTIDTNANGTGAGRCPSRYDWSKHMSAIKRLYIDEDRPLKEVMEIMQKDHNFVAT